MSKILLATWLGWLFDGLDSALFPLVANEAISELVGKDNPDFGLIASKVVVIFLLGWALGGYLFGYLGDKIGRARALSYSILTYAVFTGLTAFSHSVAELSFYRFFAGIGIGGEWALGVALLAESVESKKRIMATSFLATGFPLGYLLAVVSSFLISPHGWRNVFLVGVIPALLVFYIRKNIKEPEMWSHVEKKISNPLIIFKKEYAYNLWIAFTLGVTFTLGGWASVVFWLPVWIERTLGGGLLEKTIASFVLMAAHAVGCYLAGVLVFYFKKKTILFWSYMLTFLSAGFMYYYFHSYSSLVLVFAALTGFFFGIIPSIAAIYFPELFPTKIRTTAKGFCFNTGRIIAALGVLTSGHLVNVFGGNIGIAACIMSFIFFLGGIVSLFAPETDGKLPV